MPRLEQRIPKLEQQKPRLEQCMPRVEQEMPRLERRKCLLEKQHRFNSKMHSLELQRVRLEQQKPRRDLPLNKLAIMPSRSSFTLSRIEQETRSTSNDSCLLLVDDPMSSKCRECSYQEALAWSLS